MLEQSEESRSGFQWQMSLKAGPFQSKPFYESMKLAQLQIHNTNKQYRDHPVLQSVCKVIYLKCKPISNSSCQKQNQAEIHCSKRDTELLLVLRLKDSKLLRDGVLVLPTCGQTSTVLLGRA